MAKRIKITLVDRLIGFVTATPPEQVAKRRHGPTPTPKPPTAPKPAPLPSRSTFDVVPAEKVRAHNVATASMKDLEWIIMSRQEPQEVRRAAAERWAAIAPRPLRPHLPMISGVGHDPFWRAFRDAYREQEVF